jgi:hypothetical protein
MYSFLFVLFLHLLPTPPKGISLIAQNMKGKQGEVVCMGIAVGDFRNMLSMQFSMNWDPKVIDFLEVKNFMLPHMSRDNFGAHLRDNGILTCVWIDNALQGVTVDNGDPVFEVCFTLKGPKGSITAIEFSENPTPFEAVNFAEEVISISGINGRIEIIK